ncbi:hypothetical protein SAMN04515669_3694 [Jiangella sp. DSM 45060]|nr:hypothetical protein SAMN04515669_3694 [Jiangella sp. DSM 45060]
MQTVSEDEALRQQQLQGMLGWFDDLTSRVRGPKKRTIFDRIRDTTASAFGAVGDALGAVKGGLESANEWQADLLGYGDAQDRAREISGEGLEKYDKYVATPVERGLSTPLQLGNILDEAQRNESWSDSFEALLDGTTYEEAWHRTEDATFGQSVADMFTDPEMREQAYEAGFGEDGLPLDANYRELRQSNTAYNFVSGTADFMQEWFLDPLTVATAGAGRMRATIVGDLDRMPRGSAATMRRIVSAPDDALESLRGRAWNPVAQRSLQLRERIGQLRDQVRAGEMDQTDLIENVRAFRTDPTAAALFYDLSRARKWDADNLAYVDEFDDDVFYHGVGAILGSPTSMDKLRVAFGDPGRQIADQIDVLQNKSLPALDDEVRLAQTRFEDALTDPNISGFQAYDRAFNAQKDIATLRREGEGLHAQLEEYESYGRFINSLDDRIAGASTNVVPTATGSIVDTASHTYRSGPHGRVATVLKYPLAALRSRPGVMDLSRNIYQESAAYLTEAGAIAGNKGLERVIAANGGNLDLDGWHRKLTNHAASASNDVQRRAVAAQVEMSGIDLVAAKHGLTGDEARAIASMYNRRRHELFRDIERQGAENRAYSAAAEGETIKYRYSNNGAEETIELPLTLTQLQNTFMPMDLKALDNILTQHAGGLRGQLARKGEQADWVYNLFAQYWKPMVLFRGGYVVRNVADESLRAVAAANSLLALPDMAKAGLIGMANLAPRTLNRVSRTWNRAERRRYRRRQQQNPLMVREGTEWVYEVNPDRLKSVEKNLTPVEKYNRLRLAAGASGKRPPRAPAVVSKLQTAADGGQPFAFDVASNKSRDLSTVTRLELDDAVVPDVAGIARYAEEHSDLLSHADGVLTVTPVKGGFQVGIGRRGARYANLFSTIDQIGSRAGTVKGVKGAKLQHTGAFERGYGDNFRSVASSAPFHRVMTSTYESELRRLRTEAGRGVSSTIGEQDHAATWLRIINDQLRQDPAVRARLEGKSLDTWVKGEGREHASRIPWRSAQPYVWETELDNHLNALLPTEALRARVISGEEITELDLQRIIDSRPMDAPKALDSNAVDMSVGGRLSQMLSGARDKTYNFLATLPTDALVRHPFFNRMYKNRLKAAADTLGADEFVEKATLQTMERQAREYALRQTRRYMFAGDEMTGLTHNLRHLTVFMGAWQESLIRWARILSERPEQFVRLYANGWQQIDDTGFVEFVDANGLGKDDPDHGSLDYIRVPWADDSLRFFDKLMPGDQSAAAEVFSDFKINKNGLNTVIQGNPWWLPGTHPFVQVAASWYLKDHPDLADENSFSSFLTKYLTPLGPVGLKETFLPAAWQQQTLRYLQGADDPVFNRQMLTRVHQQRLADWEASGRQGPKPEAQESLDIAKGAQAAWIVARFMSPASFTPEVKGQFYIDQANKIQAELGYDDKAFLTYLNEFGDDQYMWWQSTTQNHTGVPATSSGFKQSEKYKALIERNPELGLLLVGLGTETDEFNYQVYRHQSETPISGLDSTTQRSPLGPEAAAAAAEERKGWSEWQYWNNKIDAELSARGLRSVEQRGAGDLKQLKAILRDDIATRYDGWREAMTAFDTDKSYGIVNSVRRLIDSGDAPDRPDWRGLEEFVDWHDRIGAELDARSMLGGSRNIEAESNLDLLYAYHVKVGELKQENLMFAEVYDRFLDNHSMTLGSGL